MPSDETTKRVYDLIDPIVTEEGCELLDVELITEYGQRILRVTIDKDSGVTVEDCSRVSSAVEDVIDVEGIVPGNYNLEVSSPGINKPLTKLSHFSKALGRTVHVQTLEKIAGRANYKGVLKTAAEGEISVEIDNQDYRIPLAMVRKAHLVG